MHEWADSGGEGNDHGVKEVHLVVLSCWVVKATIKLSRKLM